MIIRKLLPGDLEAVAEIETTSFSPWSRASLSEELANSDRMVLAATEKEKGPVIGWCSALLSGKEAELLKIAVTPSHRRTGTAKALLHHLEVKCKGLLIEDIFLEVRAKNEAARTLYEKVGFFQQGMRKRYYQNPEDDAIIYRKQLFPLKKSPR